MATFSPRLNFLPHSEQNDGVSLTDPNCTGRFCTDFQKHRKIENYSYPPSAHLHTYSCILGDTLTYTLHTHTHTLSHTYTYMHTCPRTHTHAHTPSLTHTNVCTHTLLSLGCCLWIWGPPLGSLGAAVSCLHFQAPQRPRDPPARELRTRASGPDEWLGH